MTEDEFVALVKRLEAEAARRPAAYRRRVIALGALAYAFVGVVLLAALAALGLLGLGLASGEMNVNYGFLKVGWVLLAFVYAVGRSLWVKLEPPKGIRLERTRYPELFAEIDDVRERLGAAAPHEVLLVDELNAAMSQHPRLGVLGWPRNSLILGLPLLQALPREELRAVIAHEFGHMAGEHGRAGAWVYRIRRTWAQLLERMEKDRAPGAALFRPFLRWHAPYFNAYSFVLARLQEYEADRCSALAASPRAAVDALARLDLASAAYGDHWRGVWQRADEEPEPRAQPYAQLSPAALSLRDDARASELLGASLRAETGYADTHPSLRDRAAALGEAPRVPPPVVESAAAVLLGGRVAELAAHFDREWSRAASESWKQRHEHVATRRARLAELEAKGAEAPLAGDERYERAELVEELRGPDEALALQREILAAEPTHVSANLAVGRILLARGEEAGLAHLEAAIARSHTAILPCWREGYAFLRSAGREADAERWLERARGHEQRLEAAERERSLIPFRATYLSHGLAADRLAALQRSLAQHADVKRAWFVRRRLEHLNDEQPQWVLCVERRAGWLELPGRKRALDAALEKRLTNIDVEGDVRILAVNHRRGARKIHAGVARSQIHPA